MEDIYLYFIHIKKKNNIYIHTYFLNLQVYFIHQQNKTI